MNFPDLFTDYCILGLLLLTIALFVVIENKVYKTIFTPFFALAIPYTIIILLAFSVGPKLGFLPVYTPSVFLWTCGLIIMGATGLVLHFLLQKFGKKTIALDKFNVLSEKLFHGSAMAVSRVVIILLAISFISCIFVFGFNQMGNDEFSKAYAVSGIFGHVYQLAMVLMVYMIGAYGGKSKSDLVNLLGIVFFVFILLVKSWFFIPLFAGIFYRMMLNRIALSKIILIVASGFFVFAFNYFLQSIAYNDSYDPTFYFSHFLKYFFAGPLGFSEYVRLNLDFNLNTPVLFTPLMNSVNFFTGADMVSNVDKVEVLIHTDLLSDSTSNVFTFFGRIFIVLGLAKGCFFIFILSLVLYSSLFLFFRTKNAWMLVLYCFLTGGLLFGWFDYYYYHLIFLEGPCYIIIFYYLSKLKLRSYEKNTIAG